MEWEDIGSMRISVTHEFESEEEDPRPALNSAIKAFEGEMADE